MRKQENMSHDELKKMRRMSYIKMAAMVGFVIAVIAFSSIAWFTMNREVEGEGVQMNSSDLPFELITAGEDVGGENAVTGGFASLFSKITDEYKTNPNASTIIDLIDENLSGANLTGANYEQIQWTFEDDSDGEGIGPGSSGKMTFYVLPKETGALNVTFQLHMKGYYSADRELEDRDDDKKIYDVGTLTQITTGSDADSLKALDFLNGHILYFTSATESTDENGKKVYSDFSGLIDGSFTKNTWTNGSIVTVGVPEEITIYWKWPNTFSEMAFASGDSGLSSSMTAVAGDAATHNQIVSFIRKYTTADINKIFRGSDAYISMINQEEEVQNPEDPDSESITQLKDLSGSTLTTAQIEKLSNGYNSADSAIGSKIHYMLLVLEAY